MKALVFNGPLDVRYENYPDPELGSDNSVILKVTKCSICGSDLHMYHGENIGDASYADGVEKFCVGHEFIGEIVETGPAVYNFKKGQRVLAAGGSGCGRCSQCVSGNSQTCSSITAFGLSTKLQGGQAEYVNVPNADFTLHAIPDGVSDDQAVLLTDAMATAFFGLGRTNLQPGDTVAVVGLGPIGLIGVELAYILGASRVFAIDPVEARRIQAEQLGASAVAPDNAKQVIKDETKGFGVKRVFEASGAKAAVALTTAIASRGSTVSFIGLPQPDVTLPLPQLLFKDIQVRAGVASVTGQWENLIPLLQGGRLKADGLFSHRMKLSEGREAYRMFDAREDGVLKIMLDL